MNETWMNQSPEGRHYRVRGMALVGVLLILGCAPNFVSSENHLQAVGTSAVDSLAPHIAVGNILFPEAPVPQDSEGLAVLRANLVVALQNSGSFAEVLPRVPPYRDDFWILQVELRPEFKQHFLSPWYLGMLTMFVAWPIMPRYGTIGMQLDAKIYHHGELLQHITLEGRDTVDYFIYGPYRQGALQEQTDQMMRELLAHLSETLAEQGSFHNYALREGKALEY